GRTNVRVVVRARPTANFAAENFQLNEAADSIDMRLPKDESAGLVNNQQESWHFKLDKVLSNASQQQVYDLCSAEVVRSVMDGYNGTVLAYGQTGAGKTHTMTGGHMGFADRGIVPRAISQIYSEAAARPENNITIKLSYVEIYNELMFDLLTDVGVADQSGDLSIVEDSRGNIQVRGLSTPVGGTEEEALHIFFQGDTNRHVAEHALNKGSTRSHVVFTIYVESRSRVESSEKVIFSKLHLVDLAGSERVKKTGSDGVMLKEATFINKSLTFLEQVVVALGNKHRDHIPYRQSKLTHMLKDSLGGNCKTTMVANIWPEAKMLEETASTLRFATRMMKVSNEASVNVHLDPQLLIRKYERQIKDLKQELAMHDTLAGRSRVQYEEYAPDEQKELEDKAARGRRPQIFACDSFLTPEECLAIRRLAEVNIPVQCSSKMRVDLEITPGGGDHAVLRAIERRIEALSGLKAHPGEMPWAVHFTPGAEEEPEKRVNLGLHLDTNNTREKRWLTFIIYLQTTPAHQGGHTLFPLAQTKGSKVTHLGDTLLAANLQHTGPALNSHLQEAAEQLLARGEVLAQKALVEESARPGLAVAPREGLCVAFWTRLPGSGAVDCASWHGGAAVTGEGGKWTLQKFREAPPEALKDCCVEAGGSRTPSPGLCTRPRAPAPALLRGRRALSR
ncbi:unnamed protein product, partial [Effrenium voratum]